MRQMAGKQFEGRWGSLLHLYTALQMTPDEAEIQPNSNICCVAWKSSQNGLKTFREWWRQSNIWHLNNQIGVGGDPTRARRSTVNTAVTFIEWPGPQLQMWFAAGYINICYHVPCIHLVILCLCFVHSSFHDLQFAIEISYCNLMLLHCKLQCIFKENSSYFKTSVFPSHLWKQLINIISSREMNK